MTREKARRGDQQLDQRGPSADPATGHEESLADRASRIWRRIEDATRPDASGEIDTTARGGLRDPAHELPFRAELEAQVGTDLSGVQAHSGPNAREATTQLGAEAYTVDGAIVLGTAQPSKDLVAHELVHVLQAGTGAAASRDTDEAEASSVGDRMAAGERIDPTRLAGGARGVRKREKSPTQALADLVASLATDGVSETHDDSVEGQRTTTANTDTIGAGDGLTFANEETITTGAFVAPRTEEQAAAERERVKARIDEVKLDLTIEVMVGTGKAMAQQMRALQMDAELERLEVLEPALVEGRRAQLTRDAAAARATAQAIVKETEGRQKLIDTLDTGLADLDRRDAWRIASDLAKAELAFQRTTKVTKKHSLGLNVLKGQLSKERGITEERTDEAGTTTTSSGSKDQFKIGKGAHVEHTEHRSERTEDEAGNFREKQQKVTAHGGVAMDKDGSVGLDGGAKLTKALETNHGKVTTGVACGGSVKVNIVAVPRPTPDAEQHYAVVVTMNLGAAVSLGLEKSREGKHATGTAGAAFAAKASAEITHTHVLDAQRAAEYLDSLEQTGKGDKAAAKRAPEFGLLFKALQGVEDLDDIADSVTATVGDAKAAAGMGVHESVELTLKAGGSFDLALGAEGKGGSSGGLSGGLSTEGFRTLKVTRVPGEPGQQLVDVTVMFGDTDEQHGALTAAAFGVEASVGKKQWSSAEQAVTFRLDAQLVDYDELYQTIVATSGRTELTALRKSPAFRAHVRAYTDKADAGGEGTTAIGGNLGFASSDSWTRSSSSGMEDGVPFANEQGTGTGSATLSVAGFDVLSGERTAASSFDSRGGIMTLDMNQRTDDASATTFDMPSWSEVLSADTPKDAVQEAVTEHRRQLAGYLLDPDDLLALARRAQQRELWSKVPTASLARDGGINQKDVRAWRLLGEQLVSPELDDQYGFEQLALAREVARGAAIAELMKSVGKGQGLMFLDVVLRHYDKVGGDKTDLGVSYEFPEGITPDDYLDLRFELRSVDGEVSTMTVDDAGVHPGIEHCLELEVRTAKMIDKLETTGFESERSRVEMVHELRERVAVVAARRRALENPGAATENTELEDVTALVYHREQSLMLSKRSERLLLARCERIMQDDDLFPSEISEQLEPIVGSNGQLEELYEKHVLLIGGLRDKYRAAGTPEPEWICSVSMNDDSRECDVDMDRALDALWAYHKGIPLRQGIATYDKHEEDWHTRFWHY